MKFDVQSFLYFGFAVTLLMAGNTASGVMKARKNGSYNKQELIDGIYSYILWLVSILCLIAASQIFGGEFEITIGGTTIIKLNYERYLRFYNKLKCPYKYSKGG